MEDFLRALQAALSRGYSVKFWKDNVLRAWCIRVDDPMRELHYERAVSLQNLTCLRDPLSLLGSEIAEAVWKISNTELPGA